MTAPTNYIVLQCYGHEGIFHECAFALLSLSRLYGGKSPENTEVWIYTDNPGWFDRFAQPGISLNFRQLDAGTIKQWRGQIDFVHRVKIEVLKDFTRNRDGNILYADTDVVFSAPPDTLFDKISTGHLFMHVLEARVSSCSNPILTKLNNYLRANIHMQVAGKPLWDLAMWNAGVLGFHTRYKSVLNEVLTFTDTQYPRFPKHIIEQFAFSVYFRNEGNIKTAAQQIIHYWNMKELRPLLASFLYHFRAHSWEDQAAFTAAIQLPVLMQEKVNFLHNRSVTGKLQKRTWQPAHYDWNEMIGQL